MKLEQDIEILRAPIARGLALEASGNPPIDRKNGIIRGYSVIQAGPALGHGMDVDATTLAQVAEIGNASKNGIKNRFTHPNLSGDGMGKFLGRSRNFRVEGDRVLADLHLSETAKQTPSGDLFNYVLNMAEEEPDTFGASIAFPNGGKPEPRLNADGTPMKGADGKPLPPVLRLKALQAVDVVDSPAANRDGFLSEETLPDWPQRQATAALDQLFTGQSQEHIRAKVGAFLDLYLSNKGADVMSTATETKTPEAPAALTIWNAEAKKFEAAPGVTLSEEQLAALNPKPVEITPAPPAAPPVTEQLSETDIERKRCREIMALCETGKMPGLSKGFIDSGLSIPDVKGRLFEALAAKNVPLTDEGNGAGKLGEKPDPDAKYEAEYLAEKQACLENGVRKEAFIFACKTRDGVPAEWVDA